MLKSWKPSLPTGEFRLSLPAGSAFRLPPAAKKRIKKINQQVIHFNMKIDIILSGVGGQGILSIAATIGMAAVKKNLHLKQAEVHGMSQRGGAVQSNLRLSEKEIASDLIPLAWSRPDFVG
jgi:hypothetical protein